MKRLADLLAEEVEVEGTGWRFALFVFRGPRPNERAGKVIHVSRNREETLLAVGR